MLGSKSLSQLSLFRTHNYNPSRREQSCLFSFHAAQWCGHMWPVRKHAFQEYRKHVMHDTRSNRMILYDYPLQCCIHTTKGDGILCALSYKVAWLQLQVDLSVPHSLELSSSSCSCMLCLLLYFLYSSFLIVTKQATAQDIEITQTSMLNVIIYPCIEPGRTSNETLTLMKLFWHTGNYVLNCEVIQKMQPVYIIQFCTHHYKVAKLYLSL